MRKMIAFAMSLFVGFLIVACDIPSDEPIECISGDLTYFAAMSDSEREELCEKKYVEVTGPVNYVYSNLKTIKLGGYADGVYIDCKFDSNDGFEEIEKGDVITVRGYCRSAYFSSISLEDCVLMPNTQESTTAATEESRSVETTGVEEESTLDTTPNETVPQEKPTTEDSENVTKPTTPAETAPQETTPKETVPVATTPAAPPATEAPAQSQEMVWIPTNGGQRYHRKASCSSMENPAYVSKSDAISRGFTACGRCY